MKKIVKYLFICIILIAVGEIIKRIFFKREHQSFYDTLYNVVDSNDSLKHVIGGINNYELQYDEKLINHSDTIYFKAVYEGNSKTLTYQGKCIKIPKGWDIRIENEILE